MPPSPVKISHSKRWQLSCFLASLTRLLDPLLVFTPVCLLTGEGVSVWCHFLSEEEVSVKEVPCEGEGLCEGGSLWRGLCPEGVSGQSPLHREPPSQRPSGQSPPLLTETALWTETPLRTKTPSGKKLPRQRSPQTVQFSNGFFGMLSFN